jgi:phytanoyl-CoA dioxygenase PhyH
MRPIQPPARGNARGPRQRPARIIRWRRRSTACQHGGVLSQTEIDSFVADGFVAVRGAVPGDVLRACNEEIWAALGGRGVLRDDPSTWRDPLVKITCPDSPAFAAAGTRPVLWEAFDQLIGGGRWWRRRGVGGAIPVRFPSQADPGDAVWHIEGSFDKGGDWWVNYRSRGRGLLTLYLFSDVDAASAPTRVRPGSHRDAARVLEPAGEVGMPFARAAELTAQASAGRPTGLVTGRAGDVFLCHPFLVHAASWPHTGPQPRVIAQPGVALHDAFPLVPPLSPVERAIVPDG